MESSAIERAMVLGGSSATSSDHTAQKIGMEFSLLGSGLAQGVWERVKECCEKPVQNALTVGTTTAVVGVAGYTLKRFASPRTEALTELGMFAFGLYEAVPAVRDTARAAIETWHNPSTYKQNQKLIADELGKPLFDLALYSLAGKAGFWKARQDYKLSRFYVDTPIELQATRRSTATHFPQLVEDKISPHGQHIEQIRPEENPKLAQLYARSAPSIVQVHDGNLGQTASNGIVSHFSRPTTFHGTGFIVDDDLIATNNHVIRGDAVKSVKVKLSTGEVVNADLVARDKTADLALLKVSAGTLTAKPLELGTTASLEPNSPLYAIGHPFGVSRPTASSGLLYNKRGIKFREPTHGLMDPNPSIEDFGRRFQYEGENRLTPRLRPTEPAPIIRLEVLNSTVPGYYGGSGSPVLDSSGKVVSVYSLKGKYSGGATVEHLKALIEVHKANQLPGTWLKVITHAESLPVPKDIVLESVNSAKVTVVDVKRMGPRRAATKDIAQ